MTTVNVVLTPNVDTDQTASAQSQIAAAPNGTAGNPTIINMPAGRYRIDGRLIISRKSHIRWTCLAGVPTYPNPPSDSQAFVAYTDKDGLQLGIQSGGRSTRIHYTVSLCTDVVGSFLRAEGPNVNGPTGGDPLYARYSSTREGEHAFGSYVSIDSGWEDCSYKNVWGDGWTVDGYYPIAEQPAGMNTNTNLNCHGYRIVGNRAGRMAIGVINVIGLDAVDVIDGYTGYGGVDLEPNPSQVNWDCTFTRVRVGCWFFPFTLTGENDTNPSRFTPFENAKRNIVFKDCEVLRTGNFMNGVYVITRGTDLTIDGMLDDARPSSQLNSRAITFADGAPWENVTVKNCRMRAWPYVGAPTYGVVANCQDTLTIIDNTFTGKTDNLYAVKTYYGVPQTIIHYGNVWDIGTQNDGFAPVPPTALSASSGHVTVAGGTASVSVVTPAPPDPVSPSSFFGGSPYRLRSHKGWSRLRGKAGSRLRGSEGPAERHPMRLRSPTGAGRLRSAQHPSYLRSKEPTAVPATFFTITAGHVSLSGGTALLSVRVPAITGHLTFTGGTAGTSVVGTIRPLFATSGEIAIRGGFSSLPLTVEAGQISLAGSATVTLRLVATSGGMSLAGGLALLRVGLPATSGQVAIAGNVVGLNGAVALSATSAQVSLVGGTATLGIRTAATTSGHISVQGGMATAGTTKIIHATPGELAFLGGQAALHILHRVGTDTITIHGGMGELSATEHIDLPVAPGEIHLNGGTAHLNTYNQYPEWPMGTLSDEWEMADA